MTGIKDWNEKYGHAWVLFHQGTPLETTVAVEWANINKKLTISFYCKYYLISFMIFLWSEHVSFCVNWICRTIWIKTFSPPCCTTYIFLKEQGEFQYFKLMGEGAVTISMKLCVEYQTVLLVIMFHIDHKINYLSFRPKIGAQVNTYSTCVTWHLQNTQQTGNMKNSNL